MAIHATRTGERVRLQPLEVCQPQLETEKLERLVQAGAVEPTARVDARTRAETRDRVRAENAQLAGRIQGQYEDESAGRALSALPKTGTITGFDFRQAIEKGTEDLDSQAAGAEFRDLTKFYEANKGRMSPEAVAAYENYKRYVEKSQADQRTGIRTDDWQRMRGTMKNADVLATVGTIAGAQADKFGTQGKISLNAQTGRFEVSQPAMLHAVQQLIAGNRKPMEDLYYTLDGISKELKTMGARSTLDASRLATDPNEALRAAWLSERGTQLGFAAGTAAQANLRYARQIQLMYRLLGGVKT